ncbi:MAG: DNA methyltransferase [Candidatus Pacebacteria bacterium]|nr:DNA methyltransferase [Candidatus Paceibacterota bacterium]
MTEEKKFYKTLQDIFIGAKIEGKGGFINLMRIKSNYYNKIEQLLKKDVEKALEKYPSFREELFDKLYSFFSRYFTESGSIYFNSTPFHNNVYEKVYTDEKDVILFWKTQMLYYVKTDRIFRSVPIEFENFKFYFDASQIENKKANEKRSLIYKLREIKEDKTIVFTVSYSEKGTKTEQDEILKTIKRRGIAITEEQLDRAFKVFEKQSEVDFFINKNAKAFLEEQFKLWGYQYFWEGAKEWSADRVDELQILKDIAFKIIDFISQFEDELVKIWNKPKFVKNSNYVITLDRIADKKLIEKIKKHKNYKEQVKEWEELGIDKDNPKAPIDTKYFKDLELEVLSQFEDLDKSLDGWLIKSENYQALNTILPKFKEKVQTIYIDPPFNTGEDFPYVDRFQDSSWLSLMIDRLYLGKDFLSKTGNYFVHLDKNAGYLARIILNKTLGDDNFKNEIIWGYEKPRIAKNKFKENHDNILFYCKDKDNSIFNIQYTEKKNDENNRHEKDYEGKILGDWWDIPSYSTIMSAKERVYFSSQKPEKLIARIIDCSTKKNENDFILDFFLGSGTTTAVAHKLSKKWIGIEMGKVFSDFYEDIMTIDKTDEEVNDSEDKFKVLEIIKDTKNQRVIRVLKFGILGKMKMVLAGSGHREPTKLARDLNYQGGGFFKYYELEQYEEALANCKYEDGDLFNSPSKTPYQEYVFMKDEKMLKAMEIDYKNNKVKVDLSKIYPNIDIAETLSNLTGKWIKKISDGEVEFEDGTKINTKDLDYKLIKSLIWW